MERLEEDFGQDQAQLAARGLLDNQHLAGEEPEPRHHRHTDEETLQDSDAEEPDSPD